VRETHGEVILLGDFNIHAGFGELAPLLHENELEVLNKEEHPTFTFHKKQMALDLCICSRAIAPHIDLRIIPQPYSDHAALLLKVDLPLAERLVKRALTAMHIGPNAGHL